MQTEIQFFNMHNFLFLFSFFLHSNESPYAQNFVYSNYIQFSFCSGFLFPSFVRLFVSSIRLHAAVSCPSCFRCTQFSTFNVFTFIFGDKNIQSGTHFSYMLFQSIFVILLLLTTVKIIIWTWNYNSPQIKLTAFMIWFHHFISTNFSYLINDIFHVKLKI